MGKTQRGKMSTEDNMGIKQPYFLERLVVKRIQQKAGKDFSFSDFIFPHKCASSWYLTMTSFVSISEIVKLYRILGCRDYDLKCYYGCSGECAVRPYMNTQMRKFSPTYNKPPDIVSQILEEFWFSTEHKKQKSLNHPQIHQ